MPDETNEPRHHRVDASGVSIHFTAEVVSADAVKVEDSPNPRYLRLRGGDFRCYSHVWLSVEGQWHDITIDHLPEE